MAKLSGTKIHWRQDGDPNGQVVVFANSLGTDLRLWDSIIERLPQSYRFIRFDKRGHGLSDCPRGPYSMDMLTTDTSDLLDHLAVTSCVFVGLSIGGMIAQNLAHRRPDLIRALVLSNTGAKLGEAQMWKDRINTLNNDGIGAMSDAILKRWFAPEFHQDSNFNIWENMLKRTPLVGYTGCCAAIAGTDLTKKTAKIVAPTLVIAGEHDGATPPELVRTTADLIANSQFEIIKNTGHLPCVESPGAYAEILNNFLMETSHD